jgi:PAS domain S-box-containing protein
MTGSGPGTFRRHRLTEPWEKATMDPERISKGPAGGEHAPPALALEGPLQTLVDSVPDYAILLLDEHGHIRNWPPAAERLYGWSAQEIVGEHFSRFYPSGEALKGRPELELQVAEREGRFEEEGWRYGKNGEAFWANVVVVPLRDPQGILRGFGKITRDLTERRRSEDEIRRMAAMLESASIPVVPVWEGVMLVPLIGTLDSVRSQHLMERLLQGVTDSHSPVVVIDITGVPTIDTQTAQHLLETVSAVRLLGAEVIMTGIRPNIAQTLVHLGIDLSGITTRSSLVAGLGMALAILGHKVVPHRPQA